MVIAAALLLPLLTYGPSLGEQGARAERRGAPRILGPHAPGVGRWFPDLELRVLGGAPAKLSSLAGKKGLVISMRDPECPLSKRYSPRLKALAAELARVEIGLVLVNTLSEASAAPDVEAHGFECAYALDPEEELARALGATSTTEVFLLDAARTLRYRGMLDDQYGLGFERASPRREYLREALAAVLAGEPVRVPATEAQGCLYRFDEPAALERPLTWHEEVGRIVERRCGACHREGGPAPFALTSLEQAVKKKGMLELVLEDRLMPPWFAAPETGPWANDTSLSEDERAAILAWIAAGCPPGDPAHAALALKRAEGWTIGEPDLVVAIPEPITVPAEGVVDYRYVYARTGLAEDRWVQAVEVRPGARAVVHHVLVFVEGPDVLEALEKGDRRARRRFQDGIDGYFAGTVPGQAGVVFPPGTAKRLPKDSWLKFQIHYTPNGVETTDRTEIGFVFADGPVRAEVRTSSAFERDFQIPPFAFDHEVRAEFRFPEEAEILALFPHTHLRGSRWRIELVEPGEEPGLLLSVPYYRFDWQLHYQLATPRRVPAGTVLRASAWYDNSRENPANPDPSAWVGFGEQTTDEMMIAYVSWVPVEQPEGSR